jgi:putative ATP-binding cassette transporter
MYEILRKTGLTFVSVGHRSSLIPFHDFILELDGKGGWQLKKSSEF